MDYQERGYDAIFVSDTPEYLCCPICHFVLRDPVFVISCGHKYCKPCFNRLRTDAGTFAPQCPIDRNTIDVTKVCDESGLRRTIGCLVVKCGNHDVGCTWEGQLSDLCVHEEHCQYNRGQQLVRQQQPDNSELIRMVEELRSRMDRYEECLEKKDKELAHVKMKWQEEVDVLKQENTEMKKVLKENEVQTRKLVEELKVENALIKTQQANLKKKLEEETQWLKNGMIKGTSAQAVASAQDSVVSHVPAVTKGRNLTKEPILGHLFKVYRGSATDVLITADNHITFGKECCVLGIPSALVSLGGKVYFELTCTDIWKGGGYCGFGWASPDLKPSSKKVGDIRTVHGVKWYIPTWQSCYEDGKDVSLYLGFGELFFGEQLLRSESLKDAVIGIAINMTNGQLLYSFNGKWDKPNGVAFENLSKTTQYFPVFAGSNMTLIVNLGDLDFKHAPPDQSYKKCNQLFL